jgi:cytochrome c biogenesis protein CcdA
MVGLISAYASLGVAAGTLGRLLDVSTWAYAAVAAALSIGGALGLVRPAAMCPGRSVASRMSLGMVFLFGASTVLTVAPCCAPLVAAVVAYASASADPAYGAVLLSMFALGQGLPAVLLGLGAGRIAGLLHRAALHEATAITTSALCIVLAAYYWCFV